MYCLNCQKALPDNSVFCPSCGAMIKQEATKQQIVEAQKSSAQQVPPMQSQAPAWQQPQEKAKMPAWAIAVAVIVVTLILATCTLSVALFIEANRSERSSSFYEDWLGWREEAHPREAEILAHLEEKYGEEFQMNSLFPYMPELSVGIVYLNAVRDQFSLFKLQYEDNGRQLPVSEMRDSYQLTLAGDIAEEKIQSFLDERFGLHEIRFSSAWYSFFDADASVLDSDFDPADGLLPLDFMWLPEDGLDAFFNSLDRRIYLEITVSLLNKDTFDEIAEEDIKLLAAELTDLGVVFSGATMWVEFPASLKPEENWITYTWEVRNGVITEGEFSR